MTKLLSKWLAIMDGEPTIFCPGCRVHHSFAVNKPNVIDGRDHRWIFDGNVERPTFSPSFHRLIDGGTTCHFFLRDGVLQFLGDSAHALRGQHVPLPEFSYVYLLMHGWYDAHPEQKETDAAAYKAKQVNQ